jgi:hypothetical protein
MGASPESAKIACRRHEGARALDVRLGETVAFAAHDHQQPVGERNEELDLLALLAADRGGSLAQLRLVGRGLSLADVLAFRDDDGLGPGMRSTATVIRPLPSALLAAQLPMGSRCVGACSRVPKTSGPRLSTRAQ